jgi:hypothetical protein
MERTVLEEFWRRNGPVDPKLEVIDDDDDDDGLGRRESEQPSTVSAYCPAPEQRTEDNHKVPNMFILIIYL